MDVESYGIVVRLDDTSLLGASMVRITGKIYRKRCQGTIEYRKVPVEFALYEFLDLGVSINRDTPRWMVYVREHPMKMIGGTH